MTRSAPDVIELKEYSPLLISNDRAPHGLGELLWSKYRSKFNVEFPSPKTAGQLQVTSQGWVGYIPINQWTALRINPKTEIGNLFRMLEYAYDLRGFEMLQGLMDCRSLEEFYESLAKVLAARVKARVRKGLYRAYMPQDEELSYVRGRLDVVAMLRKPWAVKPPCTFEEHTMYIEDNQVIAWTLYQIARSGLCTHRVLPTVRQAYRAMLGVAPPIPVKATSCLGRAYNRLNEDYRALHALCRLFLEHAGPTHSIGDHETIPFLIDMATLFQSFVARWLQAHPIEGLQIRPQVRMLIGENQDIEFKIDLLLADAKDGSAISVIDTKYKVPDSPSTDDISQVVTYAQAKGCHDAVLVYPVRLKRPLNTMIGDIQIRTLAFCLDGELEKNGVSFVRELLCSAT